MSTKTFVNGQENGVIAFFNDTEPCAVYVDGERQDNISYVPQEVTGENSVEYSSEYKKNIRTMQIDGNTEQYQKEGTTYPFNLNEWVKTNAPILGMDVNSAETPYIYWETPIPIPTTSKLRLDVQYDSKVLSTDQLNIVIAYSEDDIINRTGSYKVVYPYTEPVFVDQPFYLGAINPSGSINPSDSDMWSKYGYAISSDTIVSFIEDSVPSPYAPSPIQNAGRLLPDEYQEVEYIESTGTQYIDTDVKGGSNIKMQFEGAFKRITGFSSVTGSRNAYLTDANANSFCFFANTGNEDYQYYLTSYKTTDMSANKISVEMSKDGIFFNGVLKHQVAQETWSNDYNITIFAINTAGTIGCGKNHKIYSYKLYESSVLIRNFIPCYRKSDNVIGLYDLVNNVFYTNQGTGTFLKGADVDTSIECVLRGANFHKTLSLPSSVTVDGQEVELRMGGLSTTTNIPYRSHILVDRINNKVFYYEYQKLAIATAGGSRLRILQDVVWFQAGYLGTTDWQARPAICTHFKRTSSTTHNLVRFAHGGRDSIIYISLPLTMFADPTNPTKEEVTAWLQSEADKGTPVTFLTTYAEPIEHILYDKANNITTELGQQILDFVNSTQNATNIIEITSTPSVSNLSVNYAKWGGIPNANNT
jgi:hypothetical protein